ncbi:meiosis-specific nuclear structural protein 1-like [Daktulosphaira vitifoliae]|uniref:meiosis-specific nuclear structural protein 1-like n=1 Tax=Daktulosphaira vitifoliae TaxID=58002 RepID=UPI0021A9AAA5|nr:meiosis-specific nuclear structural protein 1-like [Daktulosphaira vitifoliae]
MSKAQKSELQNIQLQKTITEHKNHDIQCKELCNMQRKATKMSLYKRMHMESQEAELEANISMAKTEQSRQIALLEQEQKMAQTMAELKRKELVEKKNEQWAYENCHELRHLEKQIRTAYAKKELLAQIKEKEAKKIEAKVQDYYDDLKIIEVNEIEKRMEKELSVKQHESKLIYKKQLEKQWADTMNEKNAQKAIQMHCPLNFGNSETNSKEDKILQMKNFKKEIDECVRLKNEFKEYEQNQIDMTEKYIQNFLEYKKRRSDELSSEKKIKQEQRHKTYENVANNLVSLMTDKSENIDKKIMLQEEEQKIEDWIKQKAEYDNKINQRNALIKENNAQLLIKEEKEVKQKKQDKNLAEYFLKIYEEKNKHEEIKNDNKQKASIQYGKELKEMIDKKHFENKELWIKKQSEYIEAIKLEQQRLKEIESKQKNIVKQHEATLLGFLPPSLLTNNSL